MAALLTGGAGFIGAYTCEEPFGAGEDVVVIDNFSNAKRDVIDKISEMTEAFSQSAGA